VNTATNTVILIVLLLATAIAVAVSLVTQTLRSLSLRRRFGPEYDRAVAEFGGRSRAEAELLKREQVARTDADTDQRAQKSGRLA
jgi:hypothetical protein